MLNTKHQTLKNEILSKIEKPLDEKPKQSKNRRKQLSYKAITLAAIFLFISKVLKIEDLAE